MSKMIRVGAGVLGSAVCLVLAGCATGKVKVSTVAPRGAMENYRTVAITVVNDAGRKIANAIVEQKTGKAGHPERMII